MRQAIIVCVVAATLTAPAGAQRSADRVTLEREARTKPVHHYVFFGGDRDKIAEAKPFLENSNIEGAQVIYTWRFLEPRKDQYNFTPVRENIETLAKHGKKLWIQLQDVSFDASRKNVPQYLLDDSIYHGGVAAQYRMRANDEATAVVGGWVARRWDPAVQERFHKLLRELGKEFDGKIAGINLPETALDLGSTGKLFPEGFTYDGYRQAIVVNMKALKLAFPKSVAMQYANFIPGEWRPDEDKGYLSGVYYAAVAAGVGLGGPDLLPHRQGQVKSSYPLIRQVANRVPTGIAVQDGNLEQIDPDTGKPVTVSELLDYAMNYLRVDYIFWGTQEPYYSRDILPMLTRLKRN
jgi:hypothetical protein